VRSAPRFGLVGLALLLDAAWLPPGVLGVHLPLLALLADLPLLLLLWHDDGARWKRWVLLLGFVRFGAALHWLFEVGAFQWVGAAAFLAPVTLLHGAVLRLGVRRGLPFVPLVGLAAVLEELLRTVWLGGMPWPQRSLGLVGVDALRASAALWGAYGLSFLCGLTSAVAAGAVGVLRAHPDHRPQLAPRVLLALLLPASWAALLMLHGITRLDHVASAVAAGHAAPTAPLLLVQAAVPQSLKHARSDDAANQIFNRHTALTVAGLEAAAERRQRVLAVLWPETMIPWPMLSPSLAAEDPEAWSNLVTIAGRLKATLPSLERPPWFLVGAIHRRPDQGGAGFVERDSLFWIDAAGLPDPAEAAPPPPAKDAVLLPWELSRHDKVSLVPGGEYTPLGDVLPPLRAWRNALSVIPELEAGAERQEPFTLDTWWRFDPVREPERHDVRAGTVICFEIAFPARCRAWRRAGAQLLLNPANYAWFGETAFRAQIRAVAALRAAELGMTVVMAGNTGPTALFDGAGRPLGTFEPRTLDADGRWLADAPREDPLPAASDEATFRTGFVLAQAVADDALTPYAWWGDWPWAALALVGVAWGLLRRPRR
jgi:apolipoprotein N-acyltransferase